MLIEPRRYSTAGGYDARRYWSDRFSQHGRSLRSVGDAGLGEEDIRSNYEGQARDVFGMLDSASCNLRDAHVLDIGCGTGYYTDRLRESGVSRYTDLDITDVLLPELRLRFPDFEFVCGDITHEVPACPFEVILLIDVIEHIVTAHNLTAALRNAASALAPGGLLLLAPVLEHGHQSLFCVRFWSGEDIRRALPELEVVSRKGRTMLLQRPA